MSVGVVMKVIWIASSIDTSTTSGVPVRDAAPPRGDGREPRVRAGHVLAETPADGEGRTIGMPVPREAAAARLQDLVGEREPVVGAAVPDRRDRHGHERMAPARPRPGSPTSTMSAASSQGARSPA